MQHQQQYKMTLLAGAVAFALAACGGGGDDLASTPQVPSGALSITGTAATGAAIASAQVSVTCAAGTGQATTAADGTFTVTITDGRLPCMIKVDTDAGALYSVAESSTDSSVHANVTPLTHLVAAQVVGGNLDTAFANFEADVATQGKLSSVAVSAAVNTVITALNGTVDLNGANPLTVSFTVGDAFDQQLDVLHEKLESAGAKLDDVTATVAAGTGTQTLLRVSASATCAALRSGRYRAIGPGELDADWADHVFTLDAQTLKIDFFDGSTGTLVDKGGCEFATDDGGQVLISPAGVAFVRNAAGTDSSPTAVILPEQNVALSDLAGTWNVLGYGRDAPDMPLGPQRLVFTFDTAGKVTAASGCTGLVCNAADVGTDVALSPHPKGGYVINAGEGPIRVHPVKAANGKVTLFLLEPGDMGLRVATRQEPLSLPAVGAVTKIWDVLISPSGNVAVAAEPQTYTLTVTGVDADAKSYVRIRDTDGRVDGVELDSPLTGLRHRSAGSTVVAGGAINYSELLGMPLPGMGVSVYMSVNPAQNFFGVTLEKP